MQRLKILLLGVAALLSQHVNSIEIASQSVRQVASAPGYWPWRTFKTTSYTPPSFLITGDGENSALDPSNLFINPSNTGIKGGNGSYPMIVDNEGELVFAVRVGGTTDLRMQIYNGEPHLMYWSGYNTVGRHGGHGYGHLVIYDQNYTEFKFSPNISINPLVPTRRGLVDLHEHQMVEPGTTMLMTIYNNTPADLSQFGVKDGWVVDSLVAEVDISSGEVLFLWSPADHGVPYNASNQPVSNPFSGNGTAASPWDWSHINSAQKIGNNYLINSRLLWTTWFVDGRDGSIIWTFNGKDGGDFAPLPNGSTFSWQHHVRAHNVSDREVTISMFNNHCTIELETAAREPTEGLLLKLSLPPSKDVPVVVLRNLTVPGNALHATTQGSYTPELGNGNAFMGYGDIAVMREYDRAVTSNNNSQKLLREWKYGHGITVQSYRAFKTPWHATPAHWDPHLVVEQNANGGLQAYVSWNGATDITKWYVSAGSTPSNLTSIGFAKKKGFETTFAVSSRYKCVSVIAASGGQKIRRSNIACI